MSIAQIVKYEGDNSTFVWKHPSEDFNTSTQLIVHESQEAIFFMNGQALDLFGAGRYTLETENIPLIRKVANLPTGGQTPFHCEVYFINKTEQMAIRWGTDSKVQYLEPTYKFPISIGASGEMSLSVSDSRKLLIKLVGTEAFLGQAKLIQFFRAFLMTRVKTYIAQTMAANAINIFEADIGIVYLVVQIAVLFIFVFAEKLPTWSALVICTAIAAIAAIFMIAADAGRTEIERVEQKIKGKVFYIKNLQVDMEILAGAEKDAKTKKALEQLAEKIRFSDPMSNEQLAVLEDKISLAVENLKSSDDKMKIIEDLNLLLDERNRKCKILE